MRQINSVGIASPRGKTTKHAARVEILGVYQYQPTIEVLRAQAEICVAPTPAGKLKAAKRFFGKAALVEVLVHNTTAKFGCRFGQPGRGLNSVGWSPRLLTLDGVEQLRIDEDVAHKEILRIAFFIHQFKSTAPLKTEYGVLKLPPMQPMTLRLLKAMPYEVVD